MSALATLSALDHPVRQSKLCHWCKSINWNLLEEEAKGLFFNEGVFPPPPRPAPATVPWNHGWRRRVWATVFGACELCDFIQDVMLATHPEFSSSYGKPKLHMFFSMAEGIKRTRDPHVAFWSDTAVKVEPKHEYILETNHIVSALINPPHLSVLKTDDERITRVFPLSQLLNYDALDYMQSFCRNNHLETCIPLTLPKLDGFHLIDCESRALVSGSMLNESIPDYVALSYVWGKHAILGLHDEQSGLPEALPRTVEDALAVTIRLKYRYLWVDRYCIKDERKDEKHCQIQAMALIYGSAAATIVAAAGTDPEYGLPGVSRPRKHARRTLSVGDRQFLWTSESPKVHIDRSDWSKRGWTFQEGLLSRRRIVFTDEQVYYQCCESVACESRPLLQYDTRIRKRQYYDSPMTFPSRVFPDGSMLTLRHNQFPELVTLYTWRELTYDSDILNAFMGILQSFRRGSQPLSSIWGVPLFIEPGLAPQRQGRVETIMSGFAAGLSFILNSNVQRRDGFPSWSWTGWKASVMEWHWAPSQKSMVYLPWATLGINLWLHGIDGTIFDWSKLMEGLKDGTFDERHVAPTITAECYMLPVKIASTRHPGTVEAETRASFDPRWNGRDRLQDDVATYFVMMHDPDFCNEEQTFQAVYIGVDPQEANPLRKTSDFFLVLREKEPNVWERVGSFTAMFGQEARCLYRFEKHCPTLKAKATCLACRNCIKKVMIQLA